MKKINTIVLKMVLITLLSDVVYANNNKEGEYAYSPFKNGSISIASYFNSQNAPSVYVSTQCSKDKKPVCWPVIRNQARKILAKYGQKDSVGTVASGRYQNIAYLYYSRTYKRGKKYYTSYYFIDQNGRNYKTPNVARKPISRNITKDAKVLDVTAMGIYLNGNSILSSTIPLTQAVIENNLNGTQSIVAITNTNEILISNTKRWINTNVLLSRKGDRKGILSVYPNNNSEIIYLVE